MGSLELWQWIGVFILAGGTVVVAGTALARSGDQIATRTGLGGFLVGMLLMAGATSLPEIATGVSAVLDDAPDLAVGGVFGSSMANMAILAIIDLIHRGRVWPRIGLGHARLTAVAIGLTAVAVLAILVPSGIALGWVGLDTVFIVAAYIAAAAWMSRSKGEDERMAAAGREILAPTGWSEPATSRRSLTWEFALFGAAALLILGAAPFLALSGKGIADATGLGQTFVGALLLAVVTSLPELVASMAAVRIGAYDLAVGNLFGSNAFNMTILFAADLAYLPGPILAAVSPAQVVAGVAAILLMAIALAAVVYGTRTRLLNLEPDAIALLATYVVLLAAIWMAPG